MASLICALLVLTIVSGCGGGGGGSIDYSGLYRGDFVLTTPSSPNRVNGTIVMRVQSNGAAVANIDIDGTDADITGTVNTFNGNINFSESDAGFSVTITGRARRDDASGTVTFRDDDLTASGPFNMVKVSSGSSSLTAPSADSSNSISGLAGSLKQKLQSN